MLVFAEIMVHKSVLVARRTSYSGSSCSCIVCTSLVFIGITVVVVCQCDSYVTFLINIGDEWNSAYVRLFLVCLTANCWHLNM